MKWKGKNREFDDEAYQEPKGRDRSNHRRNKRPLDYRQFVNMDSADILAAVNNDENEE